MKNKTNKNTAVITSPFGHRPSVVRSSIAKTLEHRYLRRKVQQRLRHFDWALDAEDDPIA